MMMSANLWVQGWGAWLLWTFAAAVVALLVWSWIAGRGGRGGPERVMVTDPVCGMEFAQDKAVARSRHGGITYYFCTEACRSEFVREPERYVKAAGAGGHGAHA